jgi:hypothetical protein
MEAPRFAPPVAAPKDFITADEELLEEILATEVEALLIDIFGEPA